MKFFPPVSLFFPFKPCNNWTTYTDGVLGGNIARGKSNQIFPAGHNLFCDSICVFQLGENIWYFFPLYLYFFPPRPCNNCSTFTGGVLGENILSLCVNVFPLCLCFPPGHAFTFLPRQLLGYEMRRNNIIFSPWSGLFLLVTENL